MPLQLTPAGLETKDYAEIRADLVARAQTKFGVGIRTEPGSFLGDLIDIMALEFESLNEGVAESYASFDRRAAEGASLDSLGLITGVPRRLSTRSTVNGEVTGVNGTIIPALSKVRIPNGSEWRLAVGTIIGAGPTAVLLEAVEVGPLEADTGTITEIVDTVAGWATVTNTEDATRGRTTEDDETYRVSQKLGLTGAAARATDQGIRKNILDASGSILSVTIRSNRDVEPVDADGIPTHRFRAVVFPDTIDPQTIAQAVWEAQPSGIGSVGDETYNITDSTGYEQIIRWDFADEIPMYVEVDLTINTALYPDDGDTQVEQAVEDYGQSLNPGDDVYPLDIACAVKEIRGVLNVAVRVGPAPAPTNTAPIAIAFDEIATFDSANVTVSIL